jgi:hypothetical protein
MMRKHRTALKAYRDDPTLQVKSVWELDLPLLKTQQGIRALVLDFDGVLGAHGQEQPDKKLEVWLNSCVQAFGAGRVFILSNKPTEYRKNYFNEHFKGIEFVVSKKKPYPDGLQQIAYQAKLQTQELLIVDDRLSTGVLAAILAGANARYLTAPLIDFSQNPISELFFICLRKIERWII